MVSIVLVIGIFNFVLGFSLAILFERQIVIPIPSLRSHGSHEPTESTQETVTALGVIAPITDSDLDTELIPETWLHVLDSADVRVGALIEVSTRSVCKGLVTFRDALHQTEVSLREASYTDIRTATTEVIDELVQRGKHWTKCLTEASAAINANRDNLGYYEQAVGHLEKLLREQAADVPTSCEAVLSQWHESCLEDAIATTCTLTATVHQLRDVILETLVTIMRGENRLDVFDRRQHYDPLTHLHNRLGVELVFRNWWRENVDHQRLLSLALIDLDHYGELNRMFSTRNGDRILGTAGRLLDSFASEEHGLSQVFRFSGQTFLGFFADTDRATAVASTQALCQALENTTFCLNDQDLKLTATACVTQALPGEATGDVFSRLLEMCNTAKETGRNQVYCSCESGLEPAPFVAQTTAPRVIPVG